MQTVTVSVGRNWRTIDGMQQQMGDQLWHRLREDVHHALCRLGGIVHVDGASSVGLWDGVTEESATWVANLDDDGIAELRDILRGVAVVFRQDAVALTIGQTEFITGRFAR